MQVFTNNASHKNLIFESTQLQHQLQHAVSGFVFLQAGHQPALSRDCCRVSRHPLSACRRLCTLALRCSIRSNAATSSHPRGVSAGYCCLPASSYHACAPSAALPALSPVPACCGPRGTRRAVHHKVVLLRASGLHGAWQKLLLSTPPCCLMQS